MLNVKSILFPTDFSPCAERAYTHAAYLARRLNAHLHVLSVIYHEDDLEASPMNFLPLGSDELAAQLDLEPRESEFAQTEAGLNVTNVQIQSHSAWRSIVEYVQEKEIDLVVMGTHGRHGLDRLLLGSVAEQVVRRAPCPVLTVREDHPRDAVPAGQRVVVVPIDFSPSSPSAMSYAAGLARLYNARLELLHVIENVTLPNVYGIDPIPAATPDLETNSKKALARLAAESLPSGVEFECTVLVGHAAYDIAQFADEKKAEMIVIATHGLTGFKRFLMGSVTEQVLRAATCPVFTVRSYTDSAAETEIETESRYEAH